MSVRKKPRSDLLTVNHRNIGIDIHQNLLVCCFQLATTQDNGRETTVKEYFKSDNTENGRALVVAWCTEKEPDTIIMESTGIYWASLFNDLEKAGLAPHLINPRHYSGNMAKGKKTDEKDAEWLASLGRIGLYNPSFVSPEPYRTARLLVTAHRSNTNECTRLKNRVLKMFNNSGFRFSSYLSDPFGKTGRALMNALLEGKQGNELLSLIDSRCKAEQGELLKACRGALDSLSKVLITQYLNRIDQIEKDNLELEEEIEKALNNPEDVSAIARLEMIPGISHWTAVSLVVFLTKDPSQYFLDAHKLSRWAGVCPGNNESAGKRKSGRVPPGLAIVKNLLVEAANAAGRCQGTRLSRTYGFRKLRKGHCKSVMALAHLLVRIIFWTLKTKKPYLDQNFDYLSAFQLPRHRQPRWIAKLWQEKIMTHQKWEILKSEPERLTQLLQS